MTKNGHQIFGSTNCTPEEKILATPMIPIRFNSSPVPSLQSLSLSRTARRCAASSCNAFAIATFSSLSNFCPCYVMLWSWPLDLWPLDLKLLWCFGRHVSKLCVKFEQNRTIHGRVIRDLAHFHRQIFDRGPNVRIDLRDAWTELHQTWRGHRGIIAELRVCFGIKILDYLAAFSNSGRSKTSDVENDDKFRTFWPV